MEAKPIPNLNPENETEQAQLLSQLLLHEAAPLIRKVLRQRLGFYVNHVGANPAQPEAENLYQEIVLKLLQHRQQWLQAAEKDVIHNYRNFVITIASNACHDFLRAKAPNRARLKNRVRELFARHRDFAIWTGAAQEKLCGFTGWEGQAKSSRAMQQINRWQITPDSFIAAAGDPQQMSFASLVAAILQQANAPVELAALTNLLATLLRTEDYPVASLEQEQTATEWQPVEQGTNAEMRLEGRATLQLLWHEIKQLPAQQRLAICLSLTDQNGNDLFTILLAAEALTWRQLAGDLDIAHEEFIALLQQLPMDNESIAQYLGTTRANVNKWRWRGLQQLRARLRQEK